MYCEEGWGAGLKVVINPSCKVVLKVACSRQCSYQMCMQQIKGWILLEAMGCSAGCCSPAAPGKEGTQRLVRAAQSVAGWSPAFAFTVYPLSRILSCVVRAL